MIVVIGDDDEDDDDDNNNNNDDNNKRTLTKADPLRARIRIRIWIRVTSKI